MNNGEPIFSFPSVTVRLNLFKIIAMILNLHGWTLDSACCQMTLFWIAISYIFQIQGYRGYIECPTSKDIMCPELPDDTTISGTESSNVIYCKCYRAI